jgi:hypothetical protein
MKYIMFTEHTSDDEILMEGSPKIVVDGIKFNQGEIVTEAIVNIDFTYSNDEDEILADIIAAPGFKGLVINNKVKGLIQELGIKNTQYFPLKLNETVKGKTSNEYVIANIIGAFDVVDYSKSCLEIDSDDNSIEFIDSLSFCDAQDVELPQMFRLSSFMPLIIVSEGVKLLFEENLVTGVKFYKPEEFSL